MENTNILKMNYNLFKKIKDLAERQEKLIADEQMDEFNALLNQRKQIQREITANIRKYEAGTKITTGKIREQKVAKIAKETEDIIILIQDTDKRIEEIIISKKDAFRDDIKNIRKGRNAIRRYQGVRQKMNRFLDKKG